MLKINAFCLGPINTNAYLLYNDTEAILIDAPHDTLTHIEPFLENNHLALTALLLTHGHWDHIAGAKEIREKLKPKVYAHSADKAWIEDPSLMNNILPSKFHIQSVKVDEWLEENSQLELLGEVFEVRHVPGHAPGNILFYNKNLASAFVGDAIFQGSIGRYDLPGGNYKELIHSIKTNIYSLPEDTVLYSGHGPSTTVGQEKLTNPFVKT